MTRAFAVVVLAIIAVEIWNIYGVVHIFVQAHEGVGADWPKASAEVEYVDFDRGGLTGLGVRFTTAQGKTVKEHVGYGLPLALHRVLHEGTVSSKAVLDL